MGVSSGHAPPDEVARGYLQDLRDITRESSRASQEMRLLTRWIAALTLVNTVAVLYAVLA